jgi:hypothetical protein
VSQVHQCLHSQPSLRSTAHGRRRLVSHPSLLVPCVRGYIMRFSRLSMNIKGFIHTITDLNIPPATRTRRNESSASSTHPISDAPKSKGAVTTYTTLMADLVDPLPEPCELESPSPSEITGLRGIYPCNPLARVEAINIDIWQMPCY